MRSVVLALRQGGAASRRRLRPCDPWLAASSACGAHALAGHAHPACASGSTSGLSGQRRRFSDFYSHDADGGSKANPLGLVFAAGCLPHPDKVARGGEDGYFACPSSRSFGVADGVGGWADSGVDPGEFARCLMRFAHEGIRRDCHRKGNKLSTTSGLLSEGEADLHEELHTSLSRVAAEKVQGGSTALLGQLNGRTMSILNLGDSGALLLRPALRSPPGSDKPLLFPRVVFRSSDQTHYFNCPYQLGSSSTQIEEPDLVRVRVRVGDIIIAATDGVFDNLFDHQVQALVARHLNKSWSDNSEVEPHLQSLASSIVKQAQRTGSQEDNKDLITPFALSAHSEGLSFRGGKLDDTTVVVGLVCRGDSTAGSRCASRILIATS